MGQSGTHGRTCLYCYKSKPGHSPTPFVSSNTSLRPGLRFPVRVAIFSLLCFCCWGHPRRGFMALGLAIGSVTVGRHTLFLLYQRGLPQTLKCSSACCWCLGGSVVHFSDEGVGAEYLLSVVVATCQIITSLEL